MDDFYDILYKKPLNKNNLFISTMPYFLKRSRKAGENDLEKLVDNEKMEGSWIYVKESSTWFNTTVEHIELIDEITNERRGRGILTPEIDYNQFEIVTNYHIHTLSQVIEHRRKLMVNEKEEIDQIIKELKLKKINFNKNYLVKRVAEYFDNILSLNSVFPSDIDMLSYSKDVMDYQEPELDFRIVSPYGIIKTKFNQVRSPELVSELYTHCKAFDKLANISARTYSSKKAISDMVTEINQGMKGILTLSMKYRQEI